MEARADFVSRTDHPRKSTALAEHIDVNGNNELLKVSTKREIALGLRQVVWWAQIPPADRG